MRLFQKQIELQLFCFGHVYKYQNNGPLFNLEPKNNLEKEINILFVYSCMGRQHKRRRQAMDALYSIMYYFFKKKRQRKEITTTKTTTIFVCSLGF